MNCVNRQVSHKRFGVGVVQSLEGNTLKVYFQAYGARAFLYPEAFDGFLTAADEDFAREAAEALRLRGEQKNAAAAEAERQRLARTPAIPEKPARRARTGKKTAHADKT